jgi:hypothetical protein
MFEAILSIEELRQAIVGKFYNVAKEQFGEEIADKLLDKAMELMTNGRLVTDTVDNSRDGIRCNSSDLDNCPARGAEIEGSTRELVNVGHGPTILSEDSGPEQINHETGNRIDAIRGKGEPKEID